MIWEDKQYSISSITHDKLVSIGWRIGKIEKNWLLASVLFYANSKLLTQTESTSGLKLVLDSLELIFFFHKCIIKYKNSITNRWKQKHTTSKWYKLSSLAHATVQGRLEQMIRERRQDLEGLKLIVMMATENSRDGNGAGRPHPNLTPFIQINSHPHPI